MQRHTCYYDRRHVHDRHLKAMNIDRLPASEVVKTRRKNTARQMLVWPKMMNLSATGSGYTLPHLIAINDSAKKNNAQHDKV
jgi:hypothetical protein